MYCEGHKPTKHARKCPKCAYGAKCTAACNPGYNSNGGVARYTCAATGLWEGGTLECSLATAYCPDPADPTGFLQVVNHLQLKAGDKCDTTIGSKCTVECQVGFEPTGGNFAYECGQGILPTSGHGKWAPFKDDKPVCEPRCSKLPPVPHAEFENINDPIAPCDRKPRGPGMRPCTARCDDGYEGSGNTEYTCKEGGLGPPKWEHGNSGTQTDLQCKLTGCAIESPSDVPGRVPCPSTDIGGTCDVVCSPGWERKSGRGANTCNSDGHAGVWSGGDLVCEPISDWCDDDPVSPGVELKECGVRIVGSPCNAVCKTGSARVGGKGENYECQAVNGEPEWVQENADPLECEKKCVDDPQDPHVVMDDRCERLPRRKCLAKCDVGYKSPGGADTYTCTKGTNGPGVWQDGSLECVPLCAPGLAPVNVTETNSSAPCDDCDVGRFSYDGVECLECLEHDKNRTRCFKCSLLHGPNPDNTKCGVCASRQLVSKDGVCEAIPTGLAHLVQDAWEKQDATTHGLEIALSFLVVVGLLWCCERGCKRRSADEVRNTAAQLRQSLMGESDDDFKELTAAHLGFRVCVYLVCSGVVIALAAELGGVVAGWRVACVAATVGAWLPLPRIINGFKRTLTGLPDLPVEMGTDEMSSQGWFGLLAFVWGLIDFMRGPALCLTLGLEQQWVLMICCTCTLLITTMTTWHLAWHALGSVSESSEASKVWLAQYNIPVAVLVITASSRLDMLAIFRLRLCNRMIISLPMHSKHFHFLRLAGMFHYLIEDAPHALFCVAHLAIASELNNPEAVETHFGLDEKVFTIISAIFSGLSLVFGLVNKCFRENASNLHHTWISREIYLTVCLCLSELSNIRSRPPPPVRLSAVDNAVVATFGVGTMKAVHADRQRRKLEQVGGAPEPKPEPEEGKAEELLAQEAAVGAAAVSRPASPIARASSSNTEAE